ncbi:hypothetical protein BHE74_00032601 [Ensete ventricosum]|nr:hypothetical protein GW17_00029189 [Ensete ventricosum]RWW60404.1 hypothetical protein BHE74_00032601 [Ensete ventricosum]
MSACERTVRLVSREQMPAGAAMAQHGVAFTCMIALDVVWREVQGRWSSCSATATAKQRRPRLGGRPARFVELNSGGIVLLISGRPPAI